MMASPHARPRLAVGLWLALALPPARHALEATMTLHMLVQIPLLALAGWWLAPCLPARARESLDAWNHRGISGLLLASLAAMVWMLPRAIDAALEEPWVAIAKFVGVPLLIGLPLALSWPRTGFVVRGVFLLEVVATAFRLSRLYLLAPARLCSNYLASDQQRLGQTLLGIGVATSLWIAWRLVWGRSGLEAARTGAESGGRAAQGDAAAPPAGARARLHGSGQGA
ncbi:MAG: hypothetical protein OZ948_04530 [Deltaproteobacteria bacterium]|nr:hypothetical protein [Deltaproteobacteria bacterium]